MMRSKAFRHLIGFALIAGAALAGPAHVLLRVPAGSAQPLELAPLLAQWRQSGQVADVLLLTQGRSEKPERTAKFETFAVLEFSSDSSADLWQQQAARALPAGLIVRRAEALVHGELTPRDSNRAVFVVNTYTPRVPAARYREFVQGYIRPLYEAMRATEHLVRYTMYLERGETGTVDALSVLEYREPAAFTAITAMKTGIREKLLATVPSYAQFDKIKDTLRLDGFGTTATYAELPSAKPR